MLVKFSKFKFLIVCLQIFGSFSQETEIVKCEGYFSRVLSTLGVLVSYCIIRSTAINNANVEVVSQANQNVTELFFDRNQDIEYLPVKVRVHFPNLLSISAYDCKVKSVAQENFNNLSKLLALSLRRNQLVTIEPNTFNDLTSLEVLLLSENRIIFIDSKAFEVLIRLTRLDLVENKCIHMNFISSNEASELVASQCSKKTTTTTTETTRKKTTSKTTIGKKKHWMEYFLQTTLPD